MAHETTPRRAFLKSGAAAATLGLTGLAGCTSLTGGGDDTTQLKLAYTVPIENLVSLFAVSDIQDQLTNIGDEYELNVTQNQSTPDSLNAMAAGSLDLAVLSTVSFASAVKQEAVPGNIKMIGTDFWDAHKNWYGITVFSGAKSNITEPKDLEGKKIGVNARGTGVYATVKKQLLDTGLDPKNDVQIVELPFPTFPSAIEDGRIDAGIFPATFAVTARQKGFETVFTSQETWKSGYPFTYIAASNDTLDKKTDAIKAWGEDFAQLNKYCYNNRSKVVSAAGEHFDLSEDLIDAFFLNHHDYYRKDITIDEKRLQSAMDALVDLDFIEKSFDVKKYSTNKYIQS